MKAFMIGMICFMLVVVVGGVGVVGMGISTYNTNVRHEANIEKFDKDSKNTLSAYTLKIKDMAQIPDMYVNDLKSVVESTFQGRYGADGSKAVMQWIQEKNLPFDSSLYKNIQVAMEAGRNEFKLSQTKKLDICGMYDIQLNSAMSGMFSSVMGFPKKDVTKLCSIVLDTDTNRAFETGIAEKVSLK